MIERLDLEVAFVAIEDLLDDEVAAYGDELGVLVEWLATRSCLDLEEPSFAWEFVRFDGAEDDGSEVEVLVDVDADN